ncbi:hypothetical protein DMB66_49880 [Actinoplanes sp. ATCC 53533]|nr:hypothetical protein DMB66_49880 [Actinoplanes sp. ATCC 53533]
MWPQGLAHYVEAHDVRLPDDVMAIAERDRWTVFPALVDDPHEKGDSVSRRLAIPRGHRGRRTCYG